MEVYRDRFARPIDRNSTANESLEKIACQKSRQASFNGKLLIITLILRPSMDKTRGRIKSGKAGPEHYGRLGTQWKQYCEVVTVELRMLRK